MDPSMCPNLYRRCIAAKCRKMKGPVKEIFVRSLVLFDMFFTEFGAEDEEFQAETIEVRLVACDRLAREVITKILNLIKTLDSTKNKEEVNFWKIQAKSIEYFMDIHSKAATLKQSRGVYYSPDSYILPCLVCM